MPHKSQRFKSQRLQHANATKSQTLAFYKSQRFSATKAVLGFLPRGGANLCRFVPVRSLQTRASWREFVHVCFGLLGPFVQVGANSDGFGAL